MTRVEIFRAAGSGPEAIAVSWNGGVDTVVRRPISTRKACRETIVQPSNSYDSASSIATTQLLLTYIILTRNIHMCNMRCTVVHTTGHADSRPCCPLSCPWCACHSPGCQHTRTLSFVPPRTFAVYAYSSSLYRNNTQINVEDCDVFLALFRGSAILVSVASNSANHPTHTGDYHADP